MQSVTFVQLPDTQLLQQRQGKKVNSFSRSLSNLKFETQPIEVGNNLVTKLVKNKKPLTFKSPTMTKQLSKIYDAYPVSSKRNQLEQDYLPFIPIDQFQRTIKVNPKFIQIQFPKVKYPKVEELLTTVPKVSKPPIHNIKSHQYTKKVQQVIQHKEIQYLDSEDSFQPLTTLKDYLSQQKPGEVAKFQSDEL